MSYEDQFHYLLMTDQAIFKKTVIKRLAGAELTPGQPKILEFLSLHDGTSQKEIAAACHIEPASVTSLLNRMEERGLVERRRLGNNRKNYFVFLTDKGRETYRLVDEAFCRMEEEVFSGFSEEEQEAFSALFLRLSKQIHRLQEEEPAEK